MTTTQNLTSLISESVRKAQNGETSFDLVFADDSIPVGKNQFVVFLKPEITIQDSKVQLDKILDFVQERIAQFKLSIHNVITLSADYMLKHGVAGQHYGEINKLSTDARANISQTAAEKFAELFGKPISEVKLLGGHEVVKQYPEFTDYSLDYLWQNKENLKLAGGTYCEEIKIDSETIYVINGFHPRQLRHFTEKGRSIVIMTLSGDLPWAEARSRFIGSTSPIKAEQGSIRYELLKRKDEFGLAEVSQGMNGIHMSAGPVEAVIELARFNSDFSDSTSVKKFTDFPYGKKLKESFSAEQFDRILQNVKLSMGKENKSIIDWTEEKDSDEAIQLLQTLL